MSRLKRSPDPKSPDLYWALVWISVGIAIGAFVLTWMIGRGTPLLAAAAGIVWMGIIYVLMESR